MREASESETLLRFMDAMKQAAGCAHQLAHMQQNPNWLRIRDLLEGVRQQASKIGAGRSVPRQAILAQFDHGRLRKN
jgi:hypothetical protein